MRKPIGLALAALMLIGCHQPGNERGGGGGQAPATDVSQTRDSLAEAYVAAARTHADVVRGDYDGALSAVRSVRSDLGQAKRTARLDAQARINELDQTAIRVQRDIEHRALNTYQSTEKLVDGLQDLFAATMPPAKPTGGGAGAGVPAAKPSAEVPVMPGSWEPLKPQAPSASRQP